MQLARHRWYPFAPTPRRAPEPPRRTSYAQARAQRSGGPLDEALYTCVCGYSFKAPVTTSIGCPHCGQTQAW